MFSANISILFTELPFTVRPRAARKAGFTAVECWWPFDLHDPPQDDIAGFVASLEEAGVRLGALNFFAGDMPAGDRGVLSHPHLAEVFAANLASVVRDRKSVV